MQELVEHSVGVLARRCCGDGQSVVQWKELKKSDPDRYRWLMIDPADMHAFAHAIYGGHILF